MRGVHKFRELNYLFKNIKWNSFFFSPIVIREIFWQNVWSTIRSTWPNVAVKIRPISGVPVIVTVNFGKASTFLVDIEVTSVES